MIGLHDECFLLHFVDVHAAVNCGEPAAPINGTVQYDDTTYLSRAHYKCDGCRLLNGYDHRICKRSGIWSKSVPECVLLDGVL